MVKTLTGLPSWANLSNVASSASSVMLFASNEFRRAIVIYNDSTQVLYVKFGATASTSSFTFPLPAAALYESQPGEMYTGRIDGIWASANGTARLTEIT